MIFSFSIGTSGTGDQAYSLHVPLVLASGTKINFEGQRHVGEIDGLTVILEKHHYQYSLKISAFESIGEAQKFLEKILASLRWISLKYNLGIKFPKEIQEGRIYAKPIMVTEESNMYEIVRSAGWDAVDGDYDVDKLAIIPEHKRLTRWEPGQAKITLGHAPEAFINDLQQCLQFPFLENIIVHKKLCLAIELYAAYSFEVTSSGKFVKLITVLESLLPDKRIPDDSLSLLLRAKGFLKEERKTIKTSGGNTDSIDHLISRLGGLSKQSIGYSIGSYVSNLLEEFPDLGSSEEIVPKLKAAYNIRSRLLHDGEVDEDALKANISRLSDLIPKMLTKLFLKYSNENCNKI